LPSAESVAGAMGFVTMNGYRRRDGTELSFSPGSAAGAGRGRGTANAGAAPVPLGAGDADGVIRFAVFQSAFLPAAVHRRMLHLLARLRKPRSIARHAAQ